MNIGYYKIGLVQYILQTHNTIFWRFKWGGWSCTP